nr:cold-responsive protein kinase 1 [Ipomoea batatas]GME02834.1 cold-responsive protein kinase 1 [Ipomoea batatas]
MGCFSFLFHKKIPSPTTHLSDHEEDLYGLKNVSIFSYKDLRVATDDFSPTSKIGEGGFGCVYKGRLKNGNMAAIKVLSTKSRQGVQEFLTEIQVISDIEHENLVKLYGCCVEDDHRILVYNYLENNSLAHALLGCAISRGALLSIKLIFLFSCFRGYLAPEYAIRGHLTRKADIYSFGVLLIEIVCGRCNTNTRLPIEEQFLLERVWRLYESQELVLLVDTTMDGAFDAEQACKFLQIGLLCTQDAPKLRPSMSRVVKMLTGEMEVNKDTITKPGLITDFMDLKIKNPPKTRPENIKAAYDYILSSESDHSSLPSGTSSQVTTFTTIPNDQSTYLSTNPLQ